MRPAWPWPGQAPLVVLVDYLQQPLLVKLVHPPADDLHFTQRDITGMYFHTLSHRLALVHNLQANEEHGGSGGQLVLPVLTAGSGTEKMRLLHTYYSVSKSTCQPSFLHHDTAVYRAGLTSDYK